MTFEAGIAGVRRTSASVQRLGIVERVVAAREQHLLTEEIARYVMHANGITPSAKEPVIKPVITTLRILVRRGTVTKDGIAHGARWAITESLPETARTR
jgi:hypothetical protein